MIRTMRSTKNIFGMGIGESKDQFPLYHEWMFPALIWSIKPGFPELMDEFIPGKWPYLMLRHRL